MLVLQSTATPVLWNGSSQHAYHDRDNGVDADVAGDDDSDNAEEGRRTRRRVSRTKTRPT